MLVTHGRITPEFGALLLDFCRRTSRSSVDPEHFLLALLHSDDGELAKVCRRTAPKVNLVALRNNLFEATKNSRTQVPSSNEWTEELLSPRSKAAFELAASSPDWSDAGAEGILAHAVLGSLLPRVTRILEVSGVDPEALRSALLTAPPPERTLFDANGRLTLDHFNAAARQCLKHLEAEGGSLAQSRISAPLFLFSLVMNEQGAMDRALRLLGVVPRELREQLLQHLRGMSKGRRNDELRLAREHMQPVIELAIRRSAQVATERGYESIGDEDLALGLLLEDTLFSRGFLDSRRVDVAALSSFLRSPRPESMALAAEEEAARSLPPLPEVIDRLRARIVRQDHVIDALVPFLKRLWFGYRRKTRPLAVLLFLGNSGTGKTQLARELARAVYGSEDQLLFFEMGQFGTELSKNVFVGAPQGYVGYGEGLLTNGLRDKPESVVLFDEVEKAHASVFDVLLRFLDEGVISDPAGPVRDGRKCVIILTSNKQIDRLQDLVRMQMDALRCGREEQEMARVRIRQVLIDSGQFRKEFVNRIDELLLFNALDEQAFRKILQLELNDEQRRLREEKNLNVEFAPDVTDALLRECMARREEGARVCGKVISTNVISAVIDFFVDEANAGVKSARVFTGSHGFITVQRQDSVS